MKDEKRNLRNDLITPPGEHIDRVLKPQRKRRKRIIILCTYCGSSHVKLLEKPNLYRCVICRKRFKRMQ